MCIEEIKEDGSTEILEINEEENQDTYSNDKILFHSIRGTPISVDMIEKVSMNVLGNIFGAYKD